MLEAKRVPESVLEAVCSVSFTKQLMRPIVVTPKVAENDHLQWS